LAAPAWRAFAAEEQAPLDELHYARRSSALTTDRQAHENHQLVLNLDEDRCCARSSARRIAGAGKDLGGWYDTYAFAPGATFGQWMRAFALLRDRR
jgi:hypothetical protein